LASLHDYDVVVLDVMLPGLNGIDLCQKLRHELHDSTPVLMLTARDTLQDKVAGFDSGADDYLVKPFALVELELRLKALVRRAKGAASLRILRVGELVFDTDSYQATRAGRTLTLTKTGYTLLKCLMNAAPRVLSRDALEFEIWGDQRPDSDALRTHIHALRQTLDKPESFAMLRTVPGIGLQLLAPDDAA
jgi:DNA-binding response OmpR family regulator